MASRLGDQLTREVGVARGAAAIKVGAVHPIPLHINTENKREGERVTLVAIEREKSEGLLHPSSYLCSLRTVAKREIHGFDSCC